MSAESLVRTVSGPVQMVGFPPGHPESWVAVNVIGHERTQYISRGADVTVDGAMVSALGLVTWLATHKAEVRIRIEEQTAEHFAAVVSADFRRAT